MQHLTDYPIQEDVAFFVHESYDGPCNIHLDFYIHHKSFCIWSNNKINRIPE